MVRSVNECVTWQERETAQEERERETSGNKKESISSVVLWAPGCRLRFISSEGYEPTNCLVHFTKFDVLAE